MLLILAVVRLYAGAGLAGLSADPGLFGLLGELNRHLHDHLTQQTQKHRPFQIHNGRYSQRQTREAIDSRQSLKC